MIAIIDYEMGNLGSIQKAFKRLNKDTIISNNPSDLMKADKLILPGVGNFERGINNLEQLNLRQLLNELVIEKKVPILGICLGMQLMCNFSEEGNKEGLGWIDAEVIKFKLNNRKLKIPHMGWNTINIVKDCTLLKQNTNNEYYFVHSYFVKCNDSKDIVSMSTYDDKFVSSFNKNNIYGFQFHPEKSHKQGIDILSAFTKRLNV